MHNKPVVVVAMSGGVDSSVAAALLVEQGYQVIGMMLKLWTQPGAESNNRCCTPDSMALARRVAAILSIPFYVLDAKQFFYDSVVKPFIDDYANNLTPNPCLTCNRNVRWNFLLNHAIATGAEYLATGHYARIFQDNNDVYQLLRGVDPKKDQSYVLHVLTQEKLKHALFPLGNYTKPEVRQLAHKFNLPVAERNDSQDLCFIGADGDYRQFINRYAPQVQSPGLILDHQGNVLGTHPGLAFFTIGQRRGLNVPSSVPLYVLQKNLLENTLVVGPHEQSGCRQLTAQRVNWIAGNPPTTSFAAQVKIRYKAQEVPGVIDVLNADTISVEFDDLVRDITPGQAAVLYNGDVCIGGGIIS